MMKTLLQEVTNPYWDDPDYVESAGLALNLQSELGPSPKTMKPAVERLAQTKSAITDREARAKLEDIHRAGLANMKSLLGEAESVLLDVLRKLGFRETAKKFTEIASDFR